MAWETRPMIVGALLAVVNERLPGWLQGVVAINPLTYTVDGVRYALLGLNAFPIYIDLAVIVFFAMLMVVTGSILFSRMK
jgi:ABC-2 type transport system permease protein